ncbi:MAG: MBL fold metallo-hydrolase [Chloroflexi bacterium]|nr:MBL fold metallo-hydrolase [Chloroflexota bacterium]MBU1750154.1 MBL fold metallo-hydrolase [Chloroflexota bacterium]
MLFERIESAGLAHYSYLVGAGNEAMVIDPRRDGDVYVDQATSAGLRIAHILETHRNEDYVGGAVELAARTGAEVWHADAQWEYAYGQPVRDGQTWIVGRFTVRALHTPGHTPGHMSYVLHDASGAPWVAFTGDALFAGDVGRVDFLGPERLQEMAGLLYDSIFGRLLPLGDGVLVCPAHGAGSVCGSAIADRVWTSVGLERQHNPRLQAASRAEFIANVARELPQAPYFRRMEAWNLAGPPPLGSRPAPRPLSPAAFADQMAGAVVLDTRDELGFSAAHVPGALNIDADRLSSYAGWFVPYARPILLVNKGADPTTVVRTLARIGYDDVAGYLAGGMLAWHTAGRASQSVRTVTVQSLCRELDAHGEPWILDVRSPEETRHMPIPDAQQIHVTELPQHTGEVPRDRPVYIFCGSGVRATLAASVLQRAGVTNVIVVLGGLAGWSSTTCPLGL